MDTSPSTVRLATWAALIAENRELDLQLRDLSSTTQGKATYSPLLMMPAYIVPTDEELADLERLAASSLQQYQGGLGRAAVDELATALTLGWTPPIAQLKRFLHLARASNAETVTWRRLVHFLLAADPRLARAGGLLVGDEHINLLISLLRTERAPATLHEQVVHGVHVHYENLLRVMRMCWVEHWFSRVRPGAVLDLTLATAPGRRRRVRTTVTAIERIQPTLQRLAVFCRTEGLPEMSVMLTDGNARLVPEARVD